ncbi:MAG: sulfatase-like hydrolase/transferase [Luteitalea sp.]|nr:sulfatase-like hydrolase/transferase [Luteitalea sp.]
MKHARRVLIRFSLVGSIILLAAFQPAPSEEERPRDNVLLIISDDLRPDLGTYGNRLMRTPHIDGLASRGVRFDRAYAQYPLCNPSRASLLTGRYPTSVGVLDNITWFRAFQPFVSLPQYFQSHGYATLRAGKIFHGGMDHAEAWTEGGQPRGFTGPRRQPTPGGPSRAARSDRFVVLEGDGEDNGDYRVACCGVYDSALTVHDSQPAGPSHPQNYQIRYVCVQGPNAADHS